MVIGKMLQRRGVSVAGSTARGGKSLNTERKKGLILLGCFVGVVVAGLLAGMYFEQNSASPARHTASQNVGQLKRVEYEGRTYVEKKAMTSLLLMGTDRTEKSVSYGARQGGQADFLMLVVIDHNDREIHRLQIDRDTITEVETLGVLGNPVGTRPMQICLAHSFGSTPEQNSRFAKKAVENLLEGISIDDTIVLNMDAIGAVNSALGGVTVTLEEDLSYADAAMINGATLRLTERQAEILLHDRMQLGDGTNEARMKRQRLYLNAAVETLVSRMKQNAEFMGVFLDALDPYMVASIPRGDLIAEVNRAYHYTVLPVQSLAGEHAIGADGFVEFHVAQGATIQWVMETFYKVDIK